MASNEELAPDAPVASPCNNICQINAHSGYCTGCHRTLAEIAEWGAAPPERQRAILAALPGRMKG